MMKYAALLALVPFVLAQSTPPACALTCLISNASSSSCGGVTNVSCLCTNTAFQTAVASCYQTSCSAADIESAVAYGRQSCLAVGVTLTGSAAGSTAAASSTAASSSAASSSAMSSSAASSSTMSSSSMTSSSSTSSSVAATSSAASAASSAASSVAAAATSRTGAGFASYTYNTAVIAAAGVAGVAAFAL